jgi:dyslexia-associated protein KIAA0319-like protein
LELPKDDTTLTAFVMPSSTKYKYEWQLLSHPTTGNEFGDMQGSDTANLKLTHLKVGNYSFKLIVTGDNEFGSTTINVSVLPPRRINKPPIAVIKPANSTVQLPNKDTVLDGSYSSDDDKIVKYEWFVI